MCCEGVPVKSWEGTAAGAADVDDHELEEHASLGFNVHLKDHET